MMSIKTMLPYLIFLTLAAMCISVCGITAICLRNLIFLGTLIYLSVIDLRSYTIPDQALFVAVLAWVGTIPFSYELYGGGVGVLQSIMQALLFGGGVLGFTLLMDRLLGKETMGGGDIKLFAVAGLYLGMPESLALLFLSCVFGLCFALCSNLIAHKQKNNPQMPFGPSIAVAAWVMLLYGELIVTWYINFVMK